MALDEVVSAREKSDRVNRSSVPAAFGDDDQLPTGKNVWATATAPQFAQQHAIINVLYVDDLDAEARQISNHLTAKPDCRVSVQHTSDPGEALALCRETRFDVAVLDIWVGQQTTAAIIDSVHDACSGTVIVLTSLHPDVVRSAVGDLDGIVVLSKQYMTDATVADALDLALPK